MSEIKVNDMVMVMRWGHPHGPGSRDLAPGTPFVVGVIAEGHCDFCGAQMGPCAAISWTGRCVPLPWLKKIEPDAELSIDVERVPETVS